MNGNTVLLSAREANLVCCSNMGVNPLTSYLSISALVRLFVKSMNFHTACYSKNHRFTPSKKIFSFRENTQSVYQCSSSKTRFLLPPIRNS